MPHQVVSIRPSWMFLAVIPIVISLSNRGASAQVSLFKPPVAYQTGGYNPVSIAIADVNGDGRPDVIVANQCSGPNFCDGTGIVSVLLANADGTLQTPLTFASGGSFLYSVAVSDVNGDGKPDLLTANGCANVGGGTCSAEGAIGVLLGNGNGTFQAAVTYPSGGFAFFNAAVSVADVDGDGKLDLVVMNGCSTPCDNILPPQGSVGVLLGNGDGTFKKAMTYLSGGYFATSLRVADLNSDGKPDIVVSNWCDQNAVIGNCATQAPIGVLLGNGDGTFQTAVTYASGSEGSRSIFVADLNADGKPDLVTANCGPDGCGNFQSGGGGVGILLGNGDGTFQTALLYGAGSYISIAVADIDGDTKPDVVAANLSCTALPGSGCFDVFLGNGDGSFRAAGSYDAGIAPLSIIAEDINGDGGLDVVVTHEFGNGIGIPPGLVDVLFNAHTSRDTTPPTIRLSISPKTLWPPNGKMVPVRVSGSITDTGSGVKAGSAAYSVKDEYGQIQPAGTVILGSGGNYSFTVLLQASRRGSDLNGRHYRITVRAKDNAGNETSKAKLVIVPHNRENEVDR